MVHIILAFLTGLPTGWFFGKYIHALEKRQANAAAVFDFTAIIFSTVIPLSLWANSQDSLWVLLAFALGNAVGTRFLVKRIK